MNGKKYLINYMEINKIKIFGLSYFKLLFIFHIFVVAAILFYIGFAREKTATWFYYFLGVLAVIIIGYHIYRIATHGLKTVFWNYFHIIVVAPLFLATAFYRQNTPKVIYDIFIGLGAAALLINVYYMFSH